MASAFRFYNATLRGQYNSCVLPTRRPFAAAANAVPETQYQRWVSSKPTFLQRRRAPPPERCDGRPRPDLSSVFAPDDDGANAAPAPKKQKRRKREIQGQLRSFKVRMIPTPEQERELKRCFAATRHAYNATVNAIQGHGERPNFYERRAAYKAGGTQPEWAKPVATRIVFAGVEDAVNAFRTNIAKRAKSPGTHGAFEVKYRSHKRNQTEVLRIDGDGDGGKASPLLSFKPVPFANNPALRSECLVTFGNNLKATRGIRLQDKPRVIDRMLAEGNRLRETCKIQWEKRMRAFYFVYVYDLPATPDPDPQFETKRLVATDPGVRTFQTWWSPTSGEHGRLFNGGRQQLEDRCIAIDALTSKVAKRGNAAHSDRANPWHTQQHTPSQRRRTYRGLKRQLTRERRRLHNWMTQGHYAAANYLLDRFDVVIAPKLSTDALVRRDGRVFGSSTARAMYTWSHGLFTQRLHSAAFRYAGRHVISDSGEPGTSKTCAHCGHWHAALGANKVFTCPRCGVCMGRDVAGARNNFFAAFGRAKGVGWDGIQH